MEINIFKLEIKSIIVSANSTIIDLKIQSATNKGQHNQDLTDHKETPKKKENYFSCRLLLNGVQEDLSHIEREVIR